MRKRNIAAIAVGAILAIIVFGPRDQAVYDAEGCMEERTVAGETFYVLGPEDRMACLDEVQRKVDSGYYD